MLETLRVMLEGGSDRISMEKSLGVGLLVLSFALAILKHEVKSSLKRSCRRRTCTISTSWEICEKGTRWTMQPAANESSIEYSCRNC